MNTAKNPAGNNPAQIKGDINKGTTGDKRPGFDPAAAPLETDGEAAGTPLSDEQVALRGRLKDRETIPSRHARSEMQCAASTGLLATGPEAPFGWRPLLLW